MTPMHVERKLTMNNHMLKRLISLVAIVPDDFLGTLIDFFEKITGPNGAQWSEEIKKFLRKEATWVKVTYTRLVSGTKIIHIETSESADTIFNATQVFAGIDSRFAGLGYGFSEAAVRARQPVVIHEIVESGTLAQVFLGLDENLDNLCLTQAQIVKFVKNHKEFLRTRVCETFFLFKVNSEFFVASVNVSSGGGLSVGLYDFSYHYVWDIEHRHRVVIPQVFKS